ncbi:MAG: transposase [Phycisphaerae bacterium]|nr:transposase [Phycisphaerae bacterium]
MAEALAEFYPEARWQRCVVPWYRNIFSDVPATKVKEAASMASAVLCGAPRSNSPSLCLSA